MSHEQLSSELEKTGFPKEIIAALVDKAVDLQKATDNLSDLTREKTLDKPNDTNGLLIYIDGLLTGGKQKPQIVEELSQKGFPEDIAEELVDKVIVMKVIEFQKRHPSLAEELARSRNKNGRDSRFGFGCFLFILGAVVTGWTYWQAGPGESYVIWWGAMAIGAIYMFLSLASQ